MPSFLNKVFGYKKHDDKETARPTREPSDSSLLDGKYEAIAPVLSPTTSTFSEAQSAKDDGGFSLFRSRARGVAQKLSQKHSEDLPHLTLRLPGPKENLGSRSLHAVFEADPDSLIMLDDAVIAAKRLSPLDALVLIKACTRAITERGLETLGIMHPHWFSASPDVQRKLISLFIRSLTQSNTTTLSSSNSPTSAFENELSFTRSPHDVAAVLRWGLRHFSLENGHFGKDSVEWGWYSAFVHAERNASYPSKGFSELLLPQLPASHIEMLTATLGLISSLASRAEANSISGSKLSKFLGLWLLVATRAEQTDDWKRFYARWERAGRILEHLFLARLREESFAQRLPTRLQELIKHYPYNKGSPDTDDGLLPRPRFSTRQYDALFVRVESLLVRGTQQPKQHPIMLLLEAFQLPIEDPSVDEHMAFWNVLKTTASEEASSSSDAEGPQFTRIFVDETMHLLSLIPVDDNLPTSPTIMRSPISISQVVSRKRSSSPTKTSQYAVARSGTYDMSTPTSPTSPSSIVVTDWAQFALSGFGDAPATQPLAALISHDDDIEVTQPRPSRKSSAKHRKSRSRRRRSDDREPLGTPPSPRHDPEFIVETKLASVHMVQIDEAFIDFWSDAIVDPISSNWPTFVVCGLKQIPGSQQPIRWLVIEQAYSRQEAQSSRVPSPDGRRGRSPRPSFKSDISGFRINSVLSSARKRLSVFGKSATDLDLKKSGARTPGTGELGEVLVEEEAVSPSIPAKAGIHVDRNVAAKVTVISGETADVADQLKAGETSTALIAGAPPAAVDKEESQPFQTVAEIPSIEPTPRSSGGYNGASELPRPSEETISVERDSPRALDVVNPNVDSSANPVTAPLAADTLDSHSTQGTHDPTFLASGSVSSVETAVVAVGPGVVEARVLPVELVAQPADDDEALHAESVRDPSKIVVDVADSGSRDAVEAVAMSEPSETIAVVAAPDARPVVTDAIDHEAPEPSVEEPRVATQSSYKASADPAAAFTVGLVGGRETDEVPASEITEAKAQLAPNFTTSVGEEALEVAELAEIPTPAPELMVWVEDTPGQEISADVCGYAGVSQDSAAKPDAPDSVVPQLKVVDDAASQLVAAELQTESSFVTHRLETPSVEVALAIDTSVQDVTAERMHAMGQVAKLAAEEEQPHVQDAITQTTDAPFIQALPVSKSNDGVSAGIMSTMQEEHVAPAEVGAQAVPETSPGIVEAQEARTPMPDPEQAALVDETSGPGIVTVAHEPVEVVPAITSECAVEAESQEPVVVEDSPPPVVHAYLVVAPQSSEAELPTQPPDIQVPAGALSAGTHPEDATAALATQNEDITTKITITAQSTPDAPAPTEDTAARTSSPEIALTVEDEPPAPVKEAQVLADAAPITCEPVAITPIVTTTIEERATQDVQALGEIELPLGESATQFIDEATHHPLSVVAASAEEIVTTQLEEQENEALSLTSDMVDVTISEDTELASFASEATRVVDVNEPETLVAESELVGVGAPTPLIEVVPLLPAVVEVSEDDRPDVAPKVEITKVVESQEAVDPTTEVTVSVHESAGLS